MRRRRTDASTGLQVSEWSHYDVLRLWSLAAFFGIRVWAFDFFTDLLHDPAMGYCTKRPKPPLADEPEGEPLHKEAPLLLYPEDPNSDSLHPQTS